MWAKRRSGKAREEKRSLLKNLAVRYKTRKIKMRYESAVARIFLDSENLLWTSRYAAACLRTSVRFFPLEYPHWKRTCPFGRLPVLTNVDPWSPNANGVSSSHCVRLNTPASYARLSRVISGNFAHRINVYIRADRSQVTTFPFSLLHLILYFRYTSFTRHWRMTFFH